MHNYFPVFLFKVIPCFLNIACKIIGPSTILQAAIPDILTNVPQTYFENTMKDLLLFKNLL